MTRQINQQPRIDNSPPHSIEMNPSSKPRPKRVIGEWILSKNLGQGSMGKVKLAIHSVSKQKMACKIIPKPMDAEPLPSGVQLIGPTSSVRDILFNQDVKPLPKAKKDQLDNQRIIRETAISLLLHHPNIAALQEIIMDAHYYYMFFEYVDGGQLLDFIISHGMLNEKLARRFMRQIISAVDYCHSNSIVHRDLKIENILIDKNGVVKLIDFGLANLFSPWTHLNTFCGSLYFAAPELLSAKKYVGAEVDVWSLGVIVYVLVCGKVPFDETSMPALHAKIKSGLYKEPPHLSMECRHFISRLLVVDPTKRACMEEIKSHPWIMKMYDEPPENFIPIRQPLTLPLDFSIIKRMKGFGFGSEKQIVESMQEHISSDKPQESQKWLIGGRAITCPESPLMSVYHLIQEKQNRKKVSSKSFRFSPLEGIKTLGRNMSLKDSSSSVLSRTPFMTLSRGTDNETQTTSSFQKTLGRMFGRKVTVSQVVVQKGSSKNSLSTSTSSQQQIELRVPEIPSKSLARSSIEEKSSISAPMLPQKSPSPSIPSSTISRSLSRSDSSSIRSIRSIREPPLIPRKSTVRSLRMSVDEVIPPIVPVKSMRRSRASTLTSPSSVSPPSNPNSPKKHPNVNGISTPSPSASSPTPVTPSPSPTTLKQKQEKENTFMNTLSRIKKEASESTLVQSSKSALRKASTIWKRQEKLDQESLPGSAVRDISTTYLPIGSFYNLKSSCLQDIRKDLLHVLISTPNLVYTEQPAGFYVKVYSHSNSSKEDQESLVDKFSTLMRGKRLTTDTCHATSDSNTTEKELPILIHNNEAPLDMVPCLQFEIYIRQIAFTKQYGLQFYKVDGNGKKYQSVVSHIRSQV